MKMSVNANAKPGRWRRPTPGFPVRRPRGLRLLVLRVLLPGLALAADPKEAVVFNRDVRPLLADHCLACHGPDPGARKAGLRLDTREGLFSPTPKRPAPVIPGQPEQSVLWQRVSTEDPDDLMPPPASHKALKPEQKDLLKRWILAGAPYQSHWSLLKPERPEVPSPSAAGFAVRNPIDAFVLAGLESQGLAPAPEADRRTLARRLALDLTGLPPRPEEVEAFVRDRSPDFYSRYVERLLASPHWGEHRARYWLDAARYADTHGLHFDNYREMWPYRDWVIRAFNANLPFDRFTIEQLAGDLLESPSDDQLIATGFHRCNLTTNEGGTIEEENLANYANDRVTTTGWVWLGLTLNCASCHDHKFDPITQRDFYSMAAFFRNTQQSGYDRNWRESEVYIHVPQTPIDAARWKTLPGEIDQAREAQQHQAAVAQAEFADWLGHARPETLPRSLAFTHEHLRLPLLEGPQSPLYGRVDGSEVALAGPPPGHWRPDGPLGPAPILSQSQTLALPGAADLRMNEPFALAAWVRLPDDIKSDGAVMSRMGGDDRQLRGWDLFAGPEYFGLHLIHRWNSNGLKVRSADKVIHKGTWQHLAVTYDGSRRPPGVRLFVDGREVKAATELDRLESTLSTPVPFRLGRRDQGHVIEGLALQDVRIYRRRLDSAEVQALAAAPRLAELFARIEPEGTNTPVRAALRDYFLVSQHAGWSQATARLTALQREYELIRGRSPVTHIQQEKPGSDPIAHVLFRGQYDQPRDRVTPNTPAVLPPLPANAPRNRLGLAQWLVSPENPLTARVTVNRFWQEVFGVGLVKTTDDFGVNGEMPSHPELLDWLAAEFVRSGWDVKHLFRLIVSSSTYRQAVATTPLKLERDPQNRGLSRGPRFRMDAEMLRDYALAASGLLIPRVGGPSVRPYQPDGVWEAVAMPESNTGYYARDTGEALYRRSLYTFWKRAAPPPLMDIFNAPSREVCTVRRERTDTPLQALATLNDPQFIEAARRLAESALTQNPRPDRSVDSIATRLLARPLTPEERSIAMQTWVDALAYYGAQPDAAAQLIAVGESRSTRAIPAPKLAAMTLVANQLLNLDEVLNK